MWVCGGYILNVRAYERLKMLNEHLKNAGFNSVGTMAATGEEPEDTTTFKDKHADRYDTDPHSNLIPEKRTPQPDYVSPWPSPL